LRSQRPPSALNSSARASSANAGSINASDGVDDGLAKRRGLPNDEEKANEDCGHSPAR
jgi:hypothetical protein